MAEQPGPEKVKKLKPEEHCLAVLRPADERQWWEKQLGLPLLGYVPRTSALDSRQCGQQQGVVDEGAG